MKRLVLIRGLPGSGKSTMARDCYSDYEHVEADMYFTLINKGKYIYDGSKIKAAHAWCLKRVKSLLNAGKYVVVSNTFTRVWEMQNYLDLGYETEVITADGVYVNIHNVPMEVIEKMRDRFEEYSC